jgi:hypothetical protein
MGITIKPSRNLTAKGGIAIENVGRAHQSRRRDYDPACATALLEVLGAASQKPAGSGEVEIAQLRPGMQTAADFRSLSGALLVAQGTEITPNLLTKLLNFPRHQLPPSISVRNP